MTRLAWLDVAKGLAILGVVYIHFFMTYFEHGLLPPENWSGLAAGGTTILGIVWLKVSRLGFHAVGVFIILSGWVLMQSAARRAESGDPAWGAWYRSRFFRLYPMYWVAHLVYLLSPFVVRPEPVDGRIILSLLGLRFVDITRNFYYLNPAWWYFSMLIQFCMLFPLLFWAARRLGPGRFLLAACVAGFFARYIMLIVYPQNAFWIQGGLALSRLPEFALGMALGVWHSQSTARTERFFLGGAGLVTGLLLYPAALQLYHNGYAYLYNRYSYIFVDFATGACCCLVVIGVAGIISRFASPAKVFALVGAGSYGIFLTHQPYVTWLGLRIREQPIWMFLLIAAATMALLSAWGILLERVTNTVVNRLVPAKKA